MVKLQVADSWAVVDMPAVLSAEKPKKIQMQNWNADKNRDRLLRTVVINLH